MRNLYRIVVPAVLVALAVVVRSTGAQSPKPGPEKSPAKASRAIVDAADAADKAALEESRAAAKAIGKDLLYFESENFTYAVMIPKERLKPIVDAVESVYHEFATDAGLKGWQDLSPKQRPMVLMTMTKAELDAYTAWYAGTYPVFDKTKYVESKANVDWYLTVSTRPVLALHFTGNNEKFVQMTAAHLAGHYVAQRYGYIQNFMPAWLDEAVASHYEGKATTEIGCRCYGLYDPIKRPKTSEKMSVRGVQVSTYKTKAKPNLLAKEAKTLSEVWKLSMVDLEPKDVEKAYAVVAWMASTPGKLPAFIKSMKESWPAEVTSSHTDAKAKAYEKAIQAVFGKTVAEVEPAVRDFVKTKF